MKLVYNSASPPVIACISHEDFLSCLQKSTESAEDKFIYFLKSYPGFSHITRSLAKRLLKEFSLLKVKKTWSLNQDKFCQDP
jgi:hypothetical protein